MKMEWEREESAFMRVAPVDRFFHPLSMSSSHSPVLWTGCCDRPGVEEELREGMVKSACGKEEG